MDLPEDRVVWRMEAGSILWWEAAERDWSHAGRLEAWLSSLGYSSLDTFSIALVEAESFWDDERSIALELFTYEDDGRTLKKTVRDENGDISVVTRTVLVTAKDFPMPDWAAIAHRLASLAEHRGRINAFFDNSLISMKRQMSEIQRKYFETRDKDLDA